MAVIGRLTKKAKQLNFNILTSEFEAFIFIDKILKNRIKEYKKAISYMKKGFKNKQVIKQIIKI